MPKDANPNTIFFGMYFPFTSTAFTLDKRKPPPFFFHTINTVTQRKDKISSLLFVNTHCTQSSPLQWKWWR